MIFYGALTRTEAVYAVLEIPPGHDRHSLQKPQVFGHQNKGGRAVRVLVMIEITLLGLMSIADVYHPHIWIIQICLCGLTPLDPEYRVGMHGQDQADGCYLIKMCTARMRDDQLSLHCYLPIISYPDFRGRRAECPRLHNKLF